MAAIIDAAVQLVEEVGPDGVTIAAITARTGASHGAIYHHFGNRDGVVRAAQFARVAVPPRRDIEHLRAAVLDSADLAEFAATIELLAAGAADPGRDRVRLVRAEVLVAADRDEELAGALTRLETEVFEELVEVLLLGRERGFLRPELEVTAVAVILEALLFGLVLLTHVEPRPTGDALTKGLHRVLCAVLPDE